MRPENGGISGCNSLLKEYSAPYWSPSKSFENGIAFIIFY